MKENIKIGEYIRTYSGLISQVKAYQDLTSYDGNGKSVTFRSYDTDKGSVADIDIAKYSKIISEVVEVGDYVNEKLIHKIDKGTNYCYLYYGNCKTFVDYQIKTIVTHEQFKSVMYEV